jgi:hypothetical protein
LNSYRQQFNNENQEFKKFVGSHCFKYVLEVYFLQIQHAKLVVKNSLQKYIDAKELLGTTKKE